MNRRRILLLGGDLRQYYMAKFLAKEDFAISYYGTVFPCDLPMAHRCMGKQEVWERLEQAEDLTVILPTPVSTDDINFKSTDARAEKISMSEFTEHVKKGHTIYGGVIPGALYDFCVEQGCQITDFLKNDIVSMKNAVSTAEGAIIEAKLLSDETIFASHSLVVGFGKCGEILADRLRGLGSYVTVAARKMEVRAKAEAYGYQTTGFPLSESFCSTKATFRYVFNTVPQLVLDAQFLNLLNPDVIIIDLASKPGGVDYEYAEKQSVTAKLCPGLPGKYAAKSAGEVLAQFIIWNLTEQGS